MEKSKKRNHMEEWANGQTNIRGKNEANKQNQTDIQTLYDRINTDTRREKQKQQNRIK